MPCHTMVIMNYRGKLQTEQIRNNFDMQIKSQRILRAPLTSRWDKNVFVEKGVGGGRTLSFWAFRVGAYYLFWAFRVGAYSRWAVNRINIRNLCFALS